ncbi:MAG TPA: ATP-binding protein [Pyrinomonadaceae bacterium]|jgi:signal transduction histidine kinase/CheY-like chemotaxis protein|nr:ATP-binding protein [Pyrinomonadaceae bacterium]
MKNLTAPNGSHAYDRSSSSGSAISQLAPVVDWRVMGEPEEHFVQFYEADEFLLDSLAGFIGAGLSAEDACIVVATAAHRAALDERLRASGLDTASAQASGQFVSLDASETLSKFMSGGQPDASRFAEVVGRIISRAAEGRGRVRIFGEMVALLWAEANYTAAIRLEELWNELHRTRSFSLFCAYPMQGFGGEMLASGLSDVCTTHSRVIPAESYTALSNPDERLRNIIALQQKARTLEAEIAERKEAEERLRVSLAQEQLARAEAEQASRLKDEFLATASHELRTPLTAIIGWAHMLRHGMLNADNAARAIETIERNAKSQAQIVEDILDVSRVITGKLRLNIEAVDVASVINAAIDSVQLAADSKNIQLQVTLAPAARHVAGDAGRLQQVVWNLLSNAIKFTPAGGRIEVRLEREGAHAQLKVSDTGCGFPSDFLPYIFDRFRQADGSSTRRHGGLGLGLSIVRHLVELHGGTVSADSPGAGLGATFTIELPLANAQQNAKKEDASERYSWRIEETSARTPRSLPSLEGVRVLLVDGSTDTLNTLAAILTEYRATVHTAASAADALEVLEWYTPSVLISDLEMPCEDGYSLIGKVRAGEAERGGVQIPAIALTAYIRIEDRTRALSAGFNMFVPKPVDPNELITAILNLAEPSTATLLLSDSEM